MAITIRVWKFMCRGHLLRAYSLSASALRNCKARPLITSLVFCTVSVTAATAMDRGQFANVPLEVREWFEHLQSPDGVPCCSYVIKTAPCLFANPIFRKSQLIGLSQCLYRHSVVPCSDSIHAAWPSRSLDETHMGTQTGTALDSKQT